MGNAKRKRAVTSAADLRRQAEKLLTTKVPDTDCAQVEGEALRLLHELKVYQIELELQNAELIQARDEIESALEKYTDLYDFAPVAYFTLDQAGSIRAANLTAASFIGIERSQLLGRRFSLLIVNEHRQLFSEFFGKVFASQGKESCEVMLTTESKTPLCVLIEAIVLGAGRECRVAVIDFTQRKQAELALQKAFDEIRTLRGIVPICANCKKIRDDKGFWKQMEVYVQEHTQAVFSHGICRDCAKILYPDIDLYKSNT